MGKPASAQSAEQNPIDRLLDIMARLRDKDTGCPWDIEQNFKTIAPYTVEEAYEVADAIERGDMKDLKEELGDLLLQVVFHAQMAREESIFDFNEVVNALSDKLVYRHPHVFGDASAANAEEVITVWDKQKNAEKNHDSAIDSVTLGLPALLRAQKLQKKAGKSGFVWPDKQSAWAKLEEELAEFKAANTKDEEADELGDVLFCIVNYARLAGHDAEQILTATNRKFESRFKAMEKILEGRGQKINEASLNEMLQAWRDGKSR